MKRCKRMLKDGVHGGSSEMRAISFLHSVPIYVFSREQYSNTENNDFNTPIRSFGDNRKFDLDTKTAIRLLYIIDKHYDAIVGLTHENNL